MLTIMYKEIIFSNFNDGTIYLKDLFPLHTGLLTAIITKPTKQNLYSATHKFLQRQQFTFNPTNLYQFSELEFLMKEPSGNIESHA